MFPQSEYQFFSNRTDFLSYPSAPFGSLPLSEVRTPRRTRAQPYS